MFPKIIKNNNIDILLPNSFLDSEDTLMLKTLKIGLYARIFSIFRINNIFFYKHKDYNNTFEYYDIFEYIATPPYLRKYIPKKDIFRYTALLPPLQIPSHEGINLKNIFYKEGIIKRKFDFTFQIDLGSKIDKLIEVNSSVFNNFRVNDKIIYKFYKDSKTEDILKINEVPFFWKYHIIKEVKPLKFYIDFLKSKYIFIVATKYGKVLKIEDMLDLTKRLKKQNKKVLLIFGPLKGSFTRYLNKLSINNEELIKYNFIYFQGTKTVKLEEALISALSLFNILN